jgi:hypothetical protein
VAKKKDFLIKFAIFTFPSGLIRNIVGLFSRKMDGAGAVLTLLWDSKTIFSFFLHIVGIKT